MEPNPIPAILVVILTFPQKLLKQVIMGFPAVKI
jgi:hypothetical protein